MSDNPQYIRTDNAIIHAFITLLKQKPFEKITVQDILNETPVTRATFYAHFRDKYEIAEKIMDSFLSVRRSVRETLRSTDPQPVEILKKKFPVSYEYADVLLNVHTEKVDFRKAMSDELEQEYLATSSSPTRSLEARIYGQAGVELYLSLLRNEYSGMDANMYQQLLISVALHLLQIPNDPQAHTYLMQRISQVHQYLAASTQP